MNKTTEQSSLAWLKQGAQAGRRWIALATLCGYGNALLLILQAWLLAHTLHSLIIDKLSLAQLQSTLIALALLFPVRALLLWGKEVAGFHAGAKVRQALRQQLLTQLHALGPAYLQRKAAGSWTSVLLEQVEKLQEFYSKYLVQMRLVMLIPLTILLMVFPLNWAAGLVFLLTAPLTILFMALVGMGAADANKRNFLALSRLSGHFLDRLKGLSTIRLFDQMETEAQKMDHASEAFRQRTMEVLRMAFLSSAVLEFFASISIAVIAVYFGFSYLGELNFGHYGAGVTLFSGLLVLILAPDFFQPFRDLGTYYHAKAEAIGAADELRRLMETPSHDTGAEGTMVDEGPITLEAHDLVVLAQDGTPLTEPLSFHLPAGHTLALAGPTGCGKTSVMQAVMGLLPYQGSLQANGREIRELPRDPWLAQQTWLGQNPKLIFGTIADNLRMANPGASDDRLWQALDAAHASEFVHRLPAGLAHPIGDRASGLSVGQAQRIALARALLKPTPLLLLDEPTASLDRHSETLLQQSLRQVRQDRTCLLISHRSDQLSDADHCLTLRPKEAQRD
ncbi:heme ABC transporter permease/ATP-binding protein CydD [Ferrimonas gelatinilytica]|uniref:Cysteine/glutathione ABC transporter permease/ATP-binding protein CydD n=1 Tax=Ferrimonas gelatinilytica TaxID=1255257 RepID=A0ABP9RVQ1_9GAMM